jgi:hypothetical protein
MSVAGAPFDPGEWPRFVQLASFQRRAAQAAWRDADLRALESAILRNPRGHPVIPGTGGLRKLRFAQAGGGHGKSGSFRVCYVHFEAHGIVLLVTLYGKGEKADLTAAETHRVAALIRDIQGRLDRGDIR